MISQNTLNSSYDVYDEVLEYLLGEGYSLEESNQIMVELIDETRKKQSEIRKGRKWWNNGIETKLCYECPADGWVVGRPGHLMKCPTT